MVLIRLCLTFHRVEGDSGGSTDSDIDQVQTPELILAGDDVTKVNHLPRLIQEVPVGGRPVESHLLHVREPSQ